MATKQIVRPTDPDRDSSEDKIQRGVDRLLAGEKIVATTDKNIPKNLHQLLSRLKLATAAAAKFHSFVDGIPAAVDAACKVRERQLASMATLSKAQKAEELANFRVKERARLLEIGKEDRDTAIAEMRILCKQVLDTQADYRSNVQRLMSVFDVTAHDSVYDTQLRSAKGSALADAIRVAQRDNNMPLARAIVRRYQELPDKDKGALRQSFNLDRFCGSFVAHELAAGRAAHIGARILLAKAQLADSIAFDEIEFNTVAQRHVEIGVMQRQVDDLVATLPKAAATE